MGSTLPEVLKTVWLGSIMEAVRVSAPATKHDSDVALARLWDRFRGQGTAEAAFVSALAIAAGEAPDAASIDASLAEIPSGKMLFLERDGLSAAAIRDAALAHAPRLVLWAQLFAAPAEGTAPVPVDAETPAAAEAIAAPAPAVVPAPAPAPEPSAGAAKPKRKTRATKAPPEPTKEPSE